MYSIIASVGHAPARAPRRAPASCTVSALRLAPSAASARCLARAQPKWLYLACG